MKLMRQQGRLPVPGSSPREEGEQSSEGRGKMLVGMALKEKQAEKVDEFVDEEVPVAKKVGNWLEVAHNAGVLFSSQNEYDDEILDYENEKEGDVTLADEGDTVGDKVAEPKAKKRKTPKESRTEKVVVKSEDTISNVNKKTFKEAFNADKAGLTRQVWIRDRQSTANPKTFFSS